MERHDHYIERVEHLPPAPVVATQLLTLFSTPDRDIDRIVELISHDPALTSEALRRCNSAFFVGAQPAVDMFDAVFRLGFYEVYCMVIAVVGARTMSLARPGATLDPGSVWRHSVTTAVAAATLAKRVQVIEAVAFTAGLLHDVGKLVFASVEGVIYGDVVRKAGDFGLTLAAAEEAAFGCSHAVLGGRLLARWGLPDNVVLAVRHHHQAPAAAAPFQRLAAAVHFANWMAHQAAGGAVNAPDAGSSDAEAMELLELTADDLPTVMKQTQEELQRVQGLF